MIDGKLENDLASAIWLRQTTQQIQVLDYELHAALRIIAAGETLDLAHKRAFLAATSQRTRLMACVMRHVLGTSTDSNRATQTPFTTQMSENMVERRASLPGKGRQGAASTHDRKTGNDANLATDAGIVPGQQHLNQGPYRQRQNATEQPDV
jgi:hypothetical protein